MDVSVLFWLKEKWKAQKSLCQKVAFDYATWVLVCR